MFLLWWRKLVLTEFRRIPSGFLHSLEITLGLIWLNPEKWACEESHASLLVWGTTSVSILQFYFGNGSEIYIVRRENQRWKHFRSLSHCMEDSCLFIWFYMSKKNKHLNHWDLRYSLLWQLLLIALTSSTFWLVVLCFFFVISIHYT